VLPGPRLASIARHGVSQSEGPGFDARNLSGHFSGERLRCRLLAEWKRSARVADSGRDARGADSMANRAMPDLGKS